VEFEPAGGGYLLAAPSTPDKARDQSSSCTKIETGELLREPPRLFVFVGLSYDRRLVFGVVVFVILLIIIVIVGVSRRHRVARDRDDDPVDRWELLRDALGHVGSLPDVHDIHAWMLPCRPRVQQKAADATRRRGRGWTRRKLPKPTHHEPPSKQPPAPV
jgi:hypothetical protein